MVSYDTLLKTFKAELKEQEKYKRDTIVKLAQKLEEEKYPMGEINQRLVRDLEGFIGKSYISQILDKKYKDQSKIHEKTEKEEDKDKITVATDGTVVPDPKLEHEQEENAEFHQELDNTLDNRTEESKSLNDVVVKELDKEISLRKELEQKLEQSITHEHYQELERRALMYSELMKEIENHLGEFVKFEKDEDGQLALVGILATKDPYGGILEIDLKKFGNKIKESFQHGNSIAKIEYENYKVKKWT
jgi:hypothetical protein